MRTTTPTPEESIELLQAMIALWDSHGETIAVPLVEDSALAGTAIQTQVEHAVRLAEAVVVLMREGLYIQIAPLVRMAMECAVSAAWWTLNPNNIKASIEEAARLKGLLVADLGKLAGHANSRNKAWDDLGAEFEAFRAGEARNFERRCEALAGGAGLYPMYRLLSEASHGGVAILDEYMTEAPEADNPYGIAFVKHAPYKYLDGVLAIAVTVVGLALRAWDDFVPEHPDAAAIDRFGEEIGAVLTVAAANADSTTEPSGA